LVCHAVSLVAGFEPQLIWKECLLGQGTEKQYSSYHRNNKAGKQFGHFIFATQDSGKGTEQARENDSQGKPEHGSSFCLGEFIVLNRIGLVDQHYCNGISNCCEQQADEESLPPCQMTQFCYSIADDARQYSDNIVNLHCPSSW